MPGAPALLTTIGALGLTTTTVFAVSVVVVLSALAADDSAIGTRKATAARFDMSDA
jgi:hypothetical protein